MSRGQLPQPWRAGGYANCPSNLVAIISLCFRFGLEVNVINRFLESIAVVHIDVHLTQDDECSQMRCPKVVTCPNGKPQLGKCGCLVCPKDMGVALSQGPDCAQISCPADKRCPNGKQAQPIGDKCECTCPKAIRALLYGNTARLFDVHFHSIVYIYMDLYRLI